MEEEYIEIKPKTHRLEVKLIGKDELLVLEGNDCIDMPELIEQRFDQEKEFITFGYMAVRRSYIEWYAIAEINI